MSLRHLVKYALTLPPHIALYKGGCYVGRIVAARFRQIIVSGKDTYEPQVAAMLASRLGNFQGGDRGQYGIDVKPVLKHQFDFLGSGSVAVRHDPQPEDVSPGNRVRAATIRALIDDVYMAIDWQLDFKSGYRWQADRLSGMLRYGHEAGVDVKVPWELARMQHLPWLAIVADGEATGEFRNQVLDFAAANPPGYGVNWMCTMDVAIRAANIVLAHDLFVSGGASFDGEFESELGALVYAHGKFIRNNLEWHEEHRANHYLADICGLLFVAAYLPKSPETEEWLAFSIDQLIAEVERQFTPDGANFEASTSYHRLSAEMTVYATALVVGLNRQTEFPAWYFKRLECMAEFIIHSTKANGLVVQIGDNDSGRFFNLCPLQTLDHRATVAAINGFFDRPDFALFSGPQTELETLVVKGLAGGRSQASYVETGETCQASGRKVAAVEGDWKITSQTIIKVPDTTIFEGLEAISYPDFGLYIWRSPRLFLSVRCGPIGQNGNGGHAHNDQLAVELNIDGEDWVADPGTYVYTPSPKDRDAYRSVHAHSAPCVGDKEPARLDLGLFRLGDQAKAKCLRFDIDGFEGRHEGYKVPVHRRIYFADGCIHIADGTGDNACTSVTITDGAALRRHWSLTLPFSPAYGVREPL